MFYSPGGLERIQTTVPIIAVVKVVNTEMAERQHFLHPLVGEGWQLLHSILTPFFPRNINKINQIITEFEKRTQEDLDFIIRNLGAIYKLSFRGILGHR